MKYPIKISRDYKNFAFSSGLGNRQVFFFTKPAVAVFFLSNHKCRPVDLRVKKISK